MKVLRVDHIAFACADAGPIGEALTRFGLAATAEEEFPELEARRAAYPVGAVELEVLQGGASTPIVGPWLAEHGDGICHVCLVVEDLDGALAELADGGVTTLSGVQVSRGRRTAFLTPATTAEVLFELVEEVDPAAAPPEG